MYNEEIKKRYSTEKESTTGIAKGYLARLFTKTSEYENLVGKDISCCTLYEILDFYKTLNMTSFDTLYVLNSQLGLYTDWCLKQNLVPDCQNHFVEVDYIKLNTCINTVVFYKSIINKETLYKWLDEMVNPGDAFIFIALFEGIEGEGYCELVNLRMSDFDGNTVKLCTGRELTVSDELIKWAKASSETYEYSTIAGHCPKIYKFLDEDLIVKNLYNCKKTDDPFRQSQRMRRRIARIYDYLGVNKWMKIGSIAESGKINFINSRCKELNISVEEYITSDYVNEVDYRYNVSIKKGSKTHFLKKYEGCLV